MTLDDLHARLDVLRELGASPCRIELHEDLVRDLDDHVVPHSPALPLQPPTLFGVPFVPVHGDEHRDRVRAVFRNGRTAELVVEAAFEGSDRSSRMYRPAPPTDLDAETARAAAALLATNLSLATALDRFEPLVPVDAREPWRTAAASAAVHYVRTLIERARLTAAVREASASETRH